MPRSSSSTQINRDNFQLYSYDVFISFRGEDTRYKFVSHLIAALNRKRIKTYTDTQLERGDEISPELLSAIEQSRVHVVIFSENYASSSWCLDELSHVLEFQNGRHQPVIPVFYNVAPSLLRHPGGKYAEGLATLEKRSEEMAGKVKKWRAALAAAANLSGWELDSTRPEDKSVEAIASDILNKLNDISPRCNHFEGLVGIEKRFEIIKSLLHIGSPGVRIIGLLGMGGIGKTTIARAVFKKLCSEFDGCYFLENVREESEKHRLVKLKKKLFSAIFDEGNPDKGIAFRESTARRGQKGSLVVLDDVVEKSQFESLVEGHMSFVPGSRIIVTTRDRQVLKCIGADAIYEVEKLDSSEALQLLQSNAFRECSSKAADYSTLSEKLVHYTKGVPLALKVLGSSLYDKSKQVWEDALSKLKVTPNMDIQRVLRISYDGLDEKEKDLFLDVACFFKGCHKDFVQRVLHGCRLHPISGMEKLDDRCLITIENNVLQMHDLIQEMGWQIVHEQSSKEPGNRSRLWVPEDAYSVLKNNSGTSRVEGIFLDMRNLRELELGKEVFKETRNLRLLKIYNCFKKCKAYLREGLEHLPDSLVYLHWEWYPLKSLPAKFNPQKLVELHMPNSGVHKLWDGNPNLASLRTFDLRHSEHLTELPDLSLASNLERVELECCNSLRALPSSIGRLNKITYLDLDFCKQLEILPKLPQGLENIRLLGTAIKDLPPCFESLHKIRSLDLGCSSRLFSYSSLGNDSKFPRYLTHLDLGESEIRFVPFSIGCLSSLVELNLHWCQKLEFLPPSICDLQSLKSLDLSQCLEFKIFPEILRPMEHLETLYLDHSAIKELPSSLRNLVGLQEFLLMSCKNLESLPNSISSLTKLTHLNVSGCPRLEILPPLSGDCTSQLKLYPHNCLSSLEHLDLSESNIESLPTSISGLPNLQSLRINNCERLQSLPEFPSTLQILDASECTLLEKVPSSSRALTAGWREHVLRLREAFLFFNCPKLDQNAKANITHDAWLRILRMAALAGSGAFDAHVHDARLNLRKRSRAFATRGVFDNMLFREDKEKGQPHFCCPGNEIPMWYDWQNKGHSIEIQLSPKWFQPSFLGFAICAVVDLDEFDEYYCRVYNSCFFFRFRCKSRFQTESGKSHIFDRFLNTYNWLIRINKYKATYLFQWYFIDLLYDIKEKNREANCFHDVTSAVFHLYPLRVPHDQHVPCDFITVKQCGIRALYEEEAKDAMQTPDSQESEFLTRERRKTG